MTWEDYQKDNHLVELYEMRVATDIECPCCKHPIWRRLDVVLTSFPPQYHYECTNCCWKGTGY